MDEKQQRLKLLFAEKNNMDGKQRLFKFLKDNGALIQFCRNYKSRKGHAVNILPEKSIHDLIDESFIWEDTQEGQDFWSNLYDKAYNEYHGVYY